MILAAGRGDRLRPLTDSMPKPLVEVQGRSLLERHLDRLASAGFRRVVINLGWHGEQIAARIGSGERYGLDVVFSPEYDEILETGGGVRRALPMLGDEPFWVLNGDIHTDFPVRRSTLANDALGHLILVPTPSYRNSGDFDLVEGRITRADDPRYTFAGLAVYRPQFVANRPVERFSLAPLLFDAADAGRLTGEVYDGIWEDVGTPERLAALNHSDQPV
ncbi:MAG: nucleotidyltransferase family protein [Pseudomonadota bacterium]